jgi:hypothetical protein
MFFFLLLFIDYTVDLYIQYTSLIDGRSDFDNQKMKRKENLILYVNAAICGAHVANINEYSIDESPKTETAKAEQFAQALLRK